MVSGLGCTCRTRLKSSIVRVMPIDSMSIPRSAVKDDVEMPAKTAGTVRPRIATVRVHTGNRFENTFENFWKAPIAPDGSGAAGSATACITTSGAFTGAAERAGGANGVSRDARAGTGTTARIIRPGAACNESVAVMRAKAEVDIAEGE